jgi:hypothetical protein
MNHASKAATPSSSVARCIPALSEKALDQAAPSPGRLPGVGDEHVASLGGERIRAAGNPER